MEIALLIQKTQFQFSKGKAQVWRKNMLTPWGDLCLFIQQVIIFIFLISQPIMGPQDNNPDTLVDTGYSIGCINRNITTLHNMLSEL